MEVLVKQQIKVTGRYSIQTRDVRDSSLVTEKCFEVRNTVTDGGRDWIVKRPLILNGGRTPGGTSIQFGTGTAAIVATDTTLGGTVISKSAGYVNTYAVRDLDVNKEITIEIKRRAVFSPGEATGTFGQVGLFGSELMAGQQLKDDQGAATTVTFQENEEVTVDYSLFVTVPCEVPHDQLRGGPAITTKVVNINGTDHTLYFRGLTSFLTNAHSNALNHDGGIYSGSGGYVTSTGSHGNTWYQTYHPNSGFSVLHVEHSATVDGTYTITRDEARGKEVHLTTLIKGSQYKLSTQTITLQYTAYQDQFIKTLAMYGGNDPVFGQPLYNSVGSLEFDPPIFKGAGDELQVEFHFILEIV